MFKALKRILVWLNLMAEKATETDAINEAIVEKNIRDSKGRADKAVYANGQLQSQIILLKQQVQNQENKAKEYRMLVQDAVKRNDEANGSIYAEQLSDIESDLQENQNQLQQLQDAYKQNTEIIAESVRQIKKMEQDFVALRAKVKVSRNMENLAGMMKASITELNGIVGGEAGEAMQRMREAAASGQGQVTATLDLAKEMGASIRGQQEAKKAKGRALFAEYKAKLAPEQAATITSSSEDKPKISSTEKVTV